MNCGWNPPKCNVKFPACFQKYPGATSKTIPGNILGLHYLANRIRPDFLDGIKLEYRHRLSPNKAMTAQWTLSHNAPSGFRLGGIYTARLTGDHLVSTIHKHTYVFMNIHIYVQMSPEIQNYLKLSWLLYFFKLQIDLFAFQVTE